MSQTISESLNWAHVSEDEYHELLAAEERRLTLEILSGQPTSTPLAVLARRVTKRMAAIESPEPSQVEKIATTLHHIHLPKMAEHGVIRYNPTSRLVEPGIAFGATA